MSNETWLAFVAASAVVLAIPGPSVQQVISYALGHGRKTAFATVIGVALGHMVVMSASLAGLTALLSNSPATFAVVRWIGAAYLVYLGIRLWRAPVGKGPIADNDNLPQEKPLKIVAHCFTVTALTPRSIVFFVAFLPQFLTSSALGFEQASMLVATFVTLSIASSITYVLAAAKARQYIRKRSVRRTAKHGGGTVLISAGAVTAGYRKIAA